LIIAKELEFIAEDASESINCRINEIIKMLSSLIKSIQVS